MNYFSSWLFAVYNRSGYGSGVYGDDGSATTGGLANTGSLIVAVITIACLIIFLALLLRFWRRKPSRPKASQGHGVTTVTPTQQTETP